MQVLKTILNEPRQRLLAMLVVAAVAITALASLAVYVQNARMAPQNEAKSFLEGFDAKINQAAKIRIESRNETFEVVFTPQKGWVLPDSANYPASLDEVRKTLLGLAGLQTIEPKTARADWLSYVGLDAPPKGEGLAISVYNDKGETLTALIVGKSTDIGDPNGGTGLFVRKTASNESWLVRSAFTPRGKARDWMDKTVINVGRDRIKSVDVDPEGSPSFTVARDAAANPVFEVTPIPAGRELSAPMVTYDVTDAIADFTFDDIRPVSTFDFSKASRLVFRTFDGLMVTVLTIKIGPDYWSNIEATPIAGMTQAKKEVREIGAHTNGWAYKLPAHKGAQFMPTLESLLKPKAAK